MSSEWPTVQLKHCAAFQEGYVNPSQRNSDFFDGPIKWLRAVDLNDSVVADTSRTLSDKGFRSAGKSALLFEPGSLAISKSGTIGRLGILEDYMCGNRAVINIRVNSSICDKHYIFYVLKSRRAEMESLATGSVQKNLYTSVLGSMELELPPIDIQKAIASQLWSLDKKIQLNRQINKTLEQMAQAIFKSWFVDFEPVKAKIAALEAAGSEENALLAAIQAISGKDEAELTRLRAEQPQQYAELRATAELFPSAMQDSELGEIPEGWGVESLSSFVDITMGQSPKGDTYNSKGMGTPLVNGPVEFGSHHPVKIKWTTAPSKMSHQGDLIVCVRGSTTGRFVKSDGKYCLGRGVCSIRAGALQPYVDRLFQNELPTLLGLTTGSTFPSWSGPTLKTHRVLVPCTELMESFSRLFEPIDCGISSRVMESEYLASVRDALLPKLISGELSLSD